MKGFGFFKCKSNPTFLLQHSIQNQKLTEFYNPNPVQIPNPINVIRLYAA